MFKTEKIYSFSSYVLILFAFAITVTFPVSAFCEPDPVKELSCIGGNFQPESEDRFSKRELVDVDFCYVEYMSNRISRGPVNELFRPAVSHLSQHNEEIFNPARPHPPRRDEEILINFDDQDVAGNWGGLQVLHDFYAEFGVNFRGRNDQDGGGVCNQDGNFGVNGHSEPNFVAFNNGQHFGNGGGEATEPEFIIFDNPVDIVSILVGGPGGSPATMVAFNEDDEEIGEAEVDLQAQMQELSIERGGIAYVLVDVPQHPNFWVFDDLYFANLAELQIAPVRFDLVIAIDAEHREVLNIGNVGEGDLIFEIEDEGDDPDWLECDPVEGTVEPEEETDVAVIISTGDLEPGEYQRTIMFNSNDPGQPQVEIPVGMFVSRGEGTLNGVVTDEETQRPVEGVLLTIEGFDYEAVSDDQGRFDFGELPAWTYSIRTFIEDYLTWIEDEIGVEVDEETSIEIGLLHSEFISDPALIEVALPLNNEIDIPVNIANGGNGTLTWTVNRVFPEGMELDPWTHRWGYSAGDNLENNRLGGLEFVDGNFYVAGGESDGDNLIYVLNEEGELVRQFTQFGDSRYGYRDMTFDGNLLWGVDGDDVHGFTIGGDLEITFESPVRSSRCIGWDRENDLLWISGITSDIFGVDREGEVIQVLDRPGDLRMYGLATYPDDPDGFHLYMFCSNGEANRQVYRVDIETGEFEFVTEPEVEGSAGASTITRTWDVFSWVFMAITNSPDRIEVWHIDAPTGWVSVEPAEGVIESGDDIDLTVQLNTFSFPFDIEFTADLVFTHDGFGGESIIPVSLTAGEGGDRQEERELNLNQGWNMVSVNVAPLENDEIVLTNPLVEDGFLEIMKNGRGQFYSPAFGFSNIPGWDVEEGYMLKVTEQCQLTIEGLPVPADEALPLEAGWQLIAYYPRVDVDAVVAFSGIVDVLEIAKDGEGRFYSPAFGFSNMGDLREGMGYMVKMTDEIDLVYVVEDQIAVYYSSKYSLPQYLQIVTPTDQNMSLLILSEYLKSEYFKDEEIECGVFASDILVGSSRLSDGKCGIAIWGDDSLSTQLDGALYDQPLEIRILSDDKPIPVEYEVIAGEMSYSTNAFTVVKLTDISVIPVEFGIHTAYPNPFNSTTKITYGLPVASEVSLNLYNLSGRKIRTLFNDPLKAGVHSITLNASDLPSGLYIARMQAQDFSDIKKLILVR